MRAVMSEEEVVVEGGLDEDTETRFSPVVFESEISTSSHQSSSTAFLMPVSANQDLRPLGTAHWTFG